jgi:small GTP-binding protein
MIAVQPPRVVMIGDASVGKTAISHRICEGSWNPNTIATVSTACYHLKRKTGDDSETTLQVWDTAGAERYRALNSVYYHNALGGVLVFDLTSRPSFESLESWIIEFSGLAQQRAVIVLVGTKSDLIDKSDSTHIPLTEAQAWADAHHVHYITASACTGDGIKELVDFLFEKVPAARIAYMPTPTLNIGATPTRPKDGCCA